MAGSPRKRARREAEAAGLSPEEVEAAVAAAAAEADGRATRKRTPYDARQEVTDRIVAAMESDDGKWKKPWTALRRPQNAATGRPYNGINRFLLGMHNAVAETGDPRFCTAKQAEDKGWEVREDERPNAELSVFYGTYEKKVEGATPEEIERGEGVRTGRTLRVSRVYHASQIDGIPEWSAPVRGFDPHDEAEAVLVNSGAAIFHDLDDRAYYSPSEDEIHLPSRAAFSSADEFYGTAMHEMAHWTGGSEERVPRRSGREFGDTAYAKEELVAELSAAMVLDELGIESAGDELSHARYVKSWVKALKDDKSAIFRAASAAQEVSDYVMGFAPSVRASAEQDPPPADLVTDRAVTADEPFGPTPAGVGVGIDL